MGVDPAVCLTAPTTEFGVRQILLDLNQKLAHLQIEEDARSNVELVMAEALNNVVKHAFPSCDDAWVTLKMLTRTESLLFEVIDRGLAYPEGVLPRGNLPDNTVSTDQLPEGGFGWHIIRSLTTWVEYHRIKGENRLILKMRRS